MTSDNRRLEAQVEDLIIDTGEKKVKAITFNLVRNLIMHSCCLCCDLQSKLAHETLRRVYNEQQCHSDESEAHRLSDLETQVELARQHVASIEDKQASTLGS